MNLPIAPKYNLYVVMRNNIQSKNLKNKTN